MKLNSTNSFKSVLKISICTLLVLTLLASFLSVISFADPVDDDPRTVISAVHGTVANGKEIGDFVPVWGESVFDEDFLPTITELSGDHPAYFWNGGFRWQKKINGGWVDQTEGNFSTGTYRLKMPILVDNDEYNQADCQTGADTHRLDNTDAFTVYINGEEWTNKEIGNHSFTIGDSTCWNIYSEEYEVAAPLDLELTFPDRGSYDIGWGYVGSSIIPYSVANYTEGGTAPYTYSKLSGPTWINVSGDGTISGSRDTAQEASVLVVQVQDDVGATATIDIDVAATYVLPENRETISEVRGTIADSKTMDDFAPVYGGSVVSDDYFPEITERDADHPAYFWNGGSKWEKKNGDNWVDMDAGTFEIGTYRFRIPVYVDVDSNNPEGCKVGGYTHILDASENFHAYVNNEEWEHDNVSVSDDQSLVMLYSEEFTVTSGDLVVPAGSLTAPEFDDAEVGYARIDSKAVIVGLTNTGIFSGSRMQATLSGTNASNFVLSTNFGGNYEAPGEWNSSIYVRPEDDLGVGTYEATVTLKYDSDGDETYETTIGSCDLSFTVTNTSAVLGTAIEVDKSSVAFTSLPAGFSGSEANAVIETVTFTNTGSTTITITVANPTGDGPFGNVGYDTSTEIEPGESLDISLVPSTSSPYADTADTYEGTYVFTATNVEDDTDTATVNVTATITLTHINITSIVLSGDYVAPVVGETIPTLTYTIASVNGDASLSDILEINQLVWQKRNGSTEWDFETATGTFEEDESYRISMLFYVSASASDMYQFPMVVPTVTFDDCTLTNFQLGGDSLGMWTEEVTLTGATTPTTYTITLDPNNEIDGLSYFSDLESGETLILGSIDSYLITAPENMEFDYYEDGAGNPYDVGDTYTVTGDDTITVHWKATTPALTTINAISVEGVVPPVAGQTPTTSAVINTEGITSGSAQWDNIDGTFIEGNFVAGTTYRIKIGFTVDEGYEVSPTATIGANEDPDDTQLSLNPIDNWIGLIYTVPAPLAPTGSITIPTFDDAVEGYAAIEDKPITIAITNAYTVSPANLDFTITGANPDDFTVYLNVSAGNMEGPDTWSLTSPFSVKPDAGLTEGTYTATITLLYDADGDYTYETTIGSGDVSFTVTAAAPATTEITSVTITGVTAPVTGATKTIEGITTSTEGVTIDTNNVRWLVGGANVAFNDSVFEGETVYGIYVTVCPEDGYAFADEITATVNGNDVETANILKRGTGDVDRAILYHFDATEPAATTLYTITVSACGYGDVRFSDGDYTHGSDSKQLAEGTEVTVEALPNEGYTLTEWTDAYGNVLSTDTSYTYEVGTEDMELIATFEELFTITIVNGSADYEKAVEGTTVTITANDPEEGKMFDCWDCDNEDVTIDDYYEPETTFEMPDSDVEITAVYMDIPSGDLTWIVSDGEFELTEENEAMFSFWFEYATDAEDGFGLLKLVIDEENDIYSFYDLDDKLLFTLTEVSYNEDSTLYEIEVAEGVTSGDSISYVFTDEDKDDFAELSFYDGANLIFGYEEPTTSGDEPATSGDEPATSGDEPATSGDEPATSGDEPTTSGDEPATSGDEPTKPDSGSTSSGGSGLSAKTYKITTTIKNGTISPSNPTVDKNDDQKFKFKVDEGYVIVDVLVDGKSVGKVTEYTLKNVTSKHTIEVKTGKVEATSSSKPADKFSDVNEKDWFYDYVNYVVENGLFVGTTESTFEPNKNLTRGMLVTVLYRLDGATDTAKSTFDDVDANEYYSAPIAWATKNGYVNGVGENKFEPEANITRQDLATIIYRYLKAKGKGFTGDWMFLLKYDDKAEIEEYAYEPICWLTMNGILAGKGDNKIDPLGKATRAETAKIMQMVSELLK